MEDRLWEKSWEDGAQKWQTDPEVAYDPSMIHQIDYQGKYHSISAVHQVQPSPQRTPFIFQAGASKSGISFGGKHAEAIFCHHSSVADAKKYTSAVRAAAAAHGRDPSSIKFFQGAMLFIGRTVEEAQAKFERAKGFCSVEGGLARLSGLINVDLSVYPIDEPFAFKGELKENAVQGVINSVKSASDGRDLTPRDLGEMLALGGMGPRPIGTPEMVADELMRWVEEGDIDGFNLSGKISWPSPASNPSVRELTTSLAVVNPQSWEDVVELLVPELQKRGVYWDEYPIPGGTMRENLAHAPGSPYLADDHPGSKFKTGSTSEGVTEATVLDSADGLVHPTQDKGQDTVVQVNQIVAA